MPNWSEEVSVVENVRNTVPWTYVINDLNGKEIIGTFYEKELQKTNQQEFKFEKVIKRKGDKLYVKWKGYDNSFNSWIDKKDLVKYRIKTSQYYSKPFRSFGRNINVKVDLSNYATKADIKNISHVETSSFALKTNVADLKAEVDKLDINKLVPVPVDLSKLGDVVKNDVVKKTDYNAKITKIRNKIPDNSNLATKTALNTVENKKPDTSGLVKKTVYNTEITKIEGKISDISNLATKIASTAVENKIPNFSGLATKTALTAVENKIPDISNFARKTALTNLSNTVPDINTLIKKSDYHTKIAEIESKYVSNTEFDSKLAQANVITKRIFDAKIIELENNIK